MKELNPALLSSLLFYLRSEAKGKANAIHVLDLSKKFFSNPQKNDRRIRKACEMLRNDQKARIVSSNSAGMYWAVTEEEADEFIAQQKSKVAGNMKSVASGERIKRDIQQEKEGNLFPVGARRRDYD